MDSSFIAPCTQDRAFLGAHHGTHERRTWSVVILTAFMMVAEIIGGSLFGSIALVADGWHMATHVAALAIAGFAYLFARRHLSDARFSLGTGKFGDLAAFASAIILAMVALGVGYESLTRLFHPVTIHFQDAVPIAALGLVVNLISAWMLRDDHDHHGHSHSSHDHSSPNHSNHDQPGHAHAGEVHAVRHQDTNLRAAYVHVLADAIISLLTIGSLSAAWAFGWTFMDPLVGLIGAVVIASWALTLVRTAGRVLLDTIPDPQLPQRIRDRIEVDGDRLCDLHVWQVGPGHAAVIASIISMTPQAPSVYKQRLHGLVGLSHVTVEVNLPH